MASACTALVEGALSRAVSVVTDFAPLFYLVIGLSLAMWVAVFVRRIVTGGE